VQYILLIYTDPETDQSEMSEWYAFTEELRASGQMVAGEPLHPVETASTVRIRDGRTLITDGPFAETKEVLGGYYIVDVDDVEQATAWAAKLPSTRYGSTEVRRIMEVAMPG